MIKVYVQKCGDLDMRFEQSKVAQNKGVAGDDSGFDLMAAIGTNRVIEPGGMFCVNTGIFLAMPRGVEAQIRARSGLIRDFRFGPMVTGTVDSSYRGEVKVTCFNLGDKPYELVPGERIAQLVFAPVLPWFASLQLPHDVEIQFVSSLEKLGKTTRGDSGFGSSGR